MVADCRRDRLGLLNVLEWEGFGGRRFDFACLELVDYHSVNRTADQASQVPSVGVEANL